MKPRPISPGVLIFLLPFVLMNAPHALSVDLTLGRARVEITPPVGYPLAGYDARKEPSTAVHDPLFARVLVLRSRETSLALVACDLINFVSQRVVDGARTEYGIEHVLIASSHTHAGPRTLIREDDATRAPDRSWPDPQHSWFSQTEEKILKAIGEAARQPEPVSVVPGLSFVYLGYNRRQVDDEGQVKMIWQNPERKPSHPLDPRIGLLVFKDPQNRVRAVVVNYACHAVVLGQDNRQVSADYPGVMCRYVEERLGADALCLFVQGAAGDINPFNAGHPVDQGAFEVVEETGLALGEKVVEAVDELRLEKGLEGKLQVKHDVMEFPNRWKPGENIRVGMDTVLFDKNAALVTMPGEPFVDHQLDLEAKSEVEYTFLAGYTFSGDGGWASYIPTIEAAAEGGYGANYSTFIGVGAGEAMVDRAVINLYQMTGHDFQQMLDVLVEEVKKSH